MGNPFTEAVGNVLTKLMGNVLTEILGKVLDICNWTEVFQDERLTGAPLDRVTHHCHIIQIKGESFRFRQSLEKYELNLEGEKLAKEKQAVSS